MILTDIMMPGTSGTELVGKVVAQKPDIKVLFMSGYAEGLIIPDEVYEVLDSGGSFLEKPFTVRTLLQKVREQLDAKS
jgi:FixJ family two-component response regulator